MKMRSDSGQVAMVDALLFMTIMLVASAVVLGSVGGGVAEREGLQRYTDDFASSLLSAELEGQVYRDGDSAVETGSGGICIAQLLCDEAMLLEASNAYDFTDYNLGIMKAANALLRPGLGCAVECGPVLVGGMGEGQELPAERYASRMAVAPGAGELLTITVYVWVV